MANSLVVPASSDGSQPSQDPSSIVTPASAPKAPVEQGVNESMLSNKQPVANTEAFYSGEEEQGIRPDSDEKLRAMSQLTSLESPIGFRSGYEGELTRWLANKMTRDDLDSQGAPKISAEEANKKYRPDVPYTEPVYEQEAAINANNRDRKEMLQAYIDRGPQTGMVANLLAHATIAADPLYMTMALATGGASNVIKGVGAVAGIGELGGVAKTGFILGENLLGNAAADIPTYLAQKEAHENVSLGETVLNTVAGAALMTAAHVGLGKMIEIGKERYANSSRARIEMDLKTGQVQAELNQKIRNEAQEKIDFARSQGKTQIGSPESTYEYAPVEHPSDRPFYSGTHPDTNAPVTIADNYGDGLHMSDDKQVVNNKVSNPEGPTTGNVVTHQIEPGAKFLDLNTTLNDKEAEHFATEIENRTGIEVARSEETTIRDVLDQVKEEGGIQAVLEAQGVAKEQGYDGYHYEVKTGETSHNEALVFEKEKAPVESTEHANKETTPQETQDSKIVDRQEADRIENRAGFDESVQPEIRELSKAPPVDSEIINESAREIKTEADKVISEIPQSEIDNDPELKNDLAEHKELEKQARIEDSIFSKLKDCLVGAAS